MRILIKTIAVLCCLFGIFLTGCINLNVQHDINEDGSSEILMLYDTSALNVATEAFVEELSGEEKNLEMETCNVFNERTRWKNPKCEIEGKGKIKMSGNVNLEDSFKVSKLFPFITYTYNAKEIYNLIPDLNKEAGKNKNALSDETLKEAKPGAALSQIELNYIISMPAKISHADVGEVDGNKVTINLFDLAGKEKVSIKARSLNLIWLGGATIFLLLIALIIFIFIKKNK